MTVLSHRSFIGTTQNNTISKSTQNNSNSNYTNNSTNIYFSNQRKGCKSWYIYVLTSVTLTTLLSYYYNSHNLLLTKIKTNDEYYEYGYENTEIAYLMDESSSVFKKKNHHQTRQQKHDQRQLPIRHGIFYTQNNDRESRNIEESNTTDDYPKNLGKKIRWYPRVTWLSSCHTNKCAGNDDSIQGAYSSSNTNVHGSKHRSVTLIGNETCSYCQQESDAYIFPFERPFYDECVPMKDWQTNHFLTCNPLHEINIFDDDDNDSLFNVSLLSMEGSWRSVWKVEENLHCNNTKNVPVSNPYFVMKLLQHNHREFNHESYDYHRIDAIAMERLTSSPYVVNIYGFCGQSVITEAATSSARYHVKNSSLTSLERLRIGRDLARALSDVHNIDCNNKNILSPMLSTKTRASKCYPTLAHNDMNMANLVEVNGTIKLNDFNIGILLRWNNTSNLPCNGSPVRFASLMWKSPEEIRNVSYIDPTKADIYGLGNLLYQVLTKRQPWTHMEPNGPLDKETVAQRKLNMTLPYVKSKYSTELDSTTRALSPLYYAVFACFRYDPNDRPTAIELAHKLDVAYHYFVNEDMNHNDNNIKHILNKKGIETNVKEKIIQIESKKFKRLFEPSSSSSGSKTKISNLLYHASDNNNTIPL